MRDEHRDADAIGTPITIAMIEDTIVPRHRRHPEVRRGALRFHDWVVKMLPVSWVNAGIASRSGRPRSPP